jgi:hypothetical protein
MVQTARKPTPITAATLTSEAHKPLTLMPQNPSRMKATGCTEHDPVMELTKTTSLVAAVATGDGREHSQHD